MASKTFLPRCSSSSETKISSLFTNSSKVTTTIPQDSVYNVEIVARLDIFLLKDCKQGLCLENRSLAATELFKKMDAFGVRPDIVSYGSIINGLCKDGLADMAKELFSEMKSRGIKPNVVFYGKFGG